MNLLTGCTFQPEGNSDALTQTDGSSNFNLLSGWRVNKNLSDHDELELKNFVEKYPGHPLQTQQTAVAGDTDSLSSLTSGTFH